MCWNQLLYKIHWLIKILLVLAEAIYTKQNQWRGKGKTILPQMFAKKIYVDIPTTVQG